MMRKVRICSRHPSHKVIELPKFSKRVRVRFGSQNKHRDMDIDFNSILAISNTANKKIMKEIFIREGVKTPKYLPNASCSRGLISNGYLGEDIFFKTPFHSRGRGMRTFDKKEDAITITTPGYFEEAQVSEREFRIHVMDGEVIAIDEKRPREQTPVADRPMIKNMDSGFKFRRPMRDFPDAVLSESIKAVKALGLDFGAADVGINSNGVWIYEVNSAPSMRTKTRKLYQKALVKLIHKKILGEENIEEIERLSKEYNEWLDAQPKTD